MKNPSVSVVITAYNYERFVAQSIDSCLEQAFFNDFEVILVDDGSIDNTASIARRYGSRLQVISIPNAGVEKASNLGFSLAKGEFVVRLDADDFLYTNYLSTLAPYLSQPESSWAFLYPDYDRVDINGNILCHVQLPAFDTRELRERGDFLATGTLYRKSAIAQVGMYNEATKNCGLENYELVLRLLSHGYSGVHIQEPLFGYRIHQQSMSISRRQSIIAYGKDLAARFGLAAYRTNSNHPQGLEL